MRKMVLSLMSVAALALAACNGNVPASEQQAGASASTGTPAAANTTAAAPVPSQVSGTIALRDPAQLSANASLVVNLLDVSASAAGSAPLASKTAPAGTFPQTFALTFDPARVKAGDLYVVQATLTDGERLYTMPIQAPVLAKGSKNDGVQIELVATQTAGEKVLAAFTAEQKLLGGMKVSHGTKLDTGVSRGWQLFRQAGEVKFIRELVDYGDKGFTSTDYSFDGSKPLAIVRETKPSQNAKPTAIDRAGWSDDGTLVLKQHQVGSDVQPLDADAAANLHKQALEILSLATGGKNK
jgi:putative lipoprotein